MLLQITCTDLKEGNHTVSTATIANKRLYQRLLTLVTIWSVRSVRMTGLWDLGWNARCIIVVPHHTEESCMSDLEPDGQN